MVGQPAAAERPGAAVSRIVPDATSRPIRVLARRVSDALVEAVGTGHGRPLIAAVSGGADSSALLHLLSDTTARHGWSIRAAHVDHGIQSEEVRVAFAAAAQRLAQRVGVQFDLLSVDALGEALHSRDGVEAAARQVRYESLTQLALDRGAPAIAAAHTQDDQAETVLLHLLRGSGLDGLSGMPAKRRLSDSVDLVRPMLSLSHADSEAVCRAIGWQPVQDPSNTSAEHTRNRVRSTLLPVMRDFNPRIVERLTSVAQIASEERAALESVTVRALDQVRPDGSETIDRKRLLALPQPLAARVVREFCRARGVVLSAERTEAAMSVVSRGHGVVELPGGRLSVSDGTVSLANHGPQTAQRS